MSFNFADFAQNIYFSLVFLQLELSLTKQPHAPVQNSLAFLHPHRSVMHPLLQEQEMMFLQAVGMGSLVIRSETSLPLSPSVVHPISSGFGRSGYWHAACFKTMLGSVRA